MWVSEKLRWTISLTLNRMSWKNVVAMAADVARNGFNVTHDFGECTFRFLFLLRKKISACPSVSDCPKKHKRTASELLLTSSLSFLSFSTAEALSNVKNDNMSEAFQNLFLPNGNVPPSGLFIQRHDLADILEAVAVKGISEFYSGKIAQEMVTAVSPLFLFYFS